VRERGRSGAFLGARPQRAGRAASVTPSRPATTLPAPLRDSFAKNNPVRDRAVQVITTAVEAAKAAPVKSP
jgi:hypothetical protein